MRRWVCALLAALLVLLCAPAMALKTLGTPVAATDAQLPAYEGGAQSIGMHGGSGLILMYGRTTCGNCRATLPFLASKLALLKGIGVDVLVSLDDRNLTKERLDELALQRGWTGLTFAGNGLRSAQQNLRACGYSRSFANTKLPLILVLNPRGEIAAYSTDRLGKSGENALIKAAHSVSPVLDLGLTGEELQLQKGQTHMLIERVLPISAAPYIKLRSSNSKLVRTYKSGNIKALRPGSATITATLFGISRTCRVQVLPKAQ